MNEKITICGSMQFAEQMQELKTHLQEMGWIVLLPEISESSASYTSFPEKEKLEQKREFITNHFNRIKQSNAILVANYQKKDIDGYIGSNTLMEIAVAHALGKNIFVLNNLAPQPCEEEVKALTTTFLEGNINLISKENND